MNVVKRTDSTQIPEMDELLELISKESPRKTITPIKNPANYKALYELLDCYFINYDKRWFVSDSILVQDYLVFSTDLIDKLARKITSSDCTKLQLNKLNSFYDYLSQGDKVDKVVDTCFVFGSSSNIRVKKAIEIYKMGKCKKIFVSGKGPIYKLGSQSEADRIKEYALTCGVLINDIIVEEESMSIPDNVKRSIDLIENKDLKINSMYLIISPFAMRRAYINWLKFLPSHINIDIKRIPSDVSDKFSVNNWYKDINTCKIVLNEFFKIRGEYLIDIMLSEKYG